jgi:hypothetical protein
MAMLNADLRDVSDDDMRERGYRCFDPGEYLFHVIESDYRQTKSKDGMVLRLVWDCMEPGRRGKLFDWLTLEHPNEMTVKIARAKLKEIALATGHPTPDFIRASEELHHKPCLLKLKKVKAGKGYGDDEGYQNEILAYNAPDSARAPAGRSDGRQDPPPIGDDDIPF